jgi:TolB-like protein/tetratricopeptide (TPR) repeat protein
MFALAAVAMAIVAVAVWRPWQSQGKVTRETITATVAPTSAQPDSKSIAVLAFANMSADKESTDYFSDGISDEILNALDRNPALRVTPRTSSFSFKGRNVPLEEIGRTLRVASVIEGSVKKAGNEVRITVKLLNAATGSRVWSEEFVRQLTTADIFAVQSEIAAKVAAKLGGAAIAPIASVSFPSGAQTTNLEAHDFYLRGLALQMAPQSAATQLEIVKLYQEATRRDPGYALAWARMSEMLLALRSSHFDRGPETTAKALDAAATAMRLAPHLPEAQLAVARVRLNINGEHDTTQQALDEVARLAPNNAEAALLRAELERARGRWDKALVQLCARAAELDPQNAVALNRAAALLNTIGEFAEADRLSRRSWDLSPTGTLAIRRLASIRVAWTGDVKDALELLNSLPAPLRADGLVAALRAGMYELLGDPGSAVGAYEEGMRDAKAYTTSGPRGYPIMVGYNLARLQPDRATAHLNEALHLARRFVIDFPDLDDGPRYLARIHAARGEREAALAAVADATARVARTKYAVQIAAMRRLRAEVLALLGDNEAAIAELQAVHGMGYGFGYTLRLEPAWARLRGEPKFQQLMKAAEARADAQPRPKK